MKIRIHGEPTMITFPKGKVESWIEGENDEVVVLNVRWWRWWGIFKRSEKIKYVKLEDFMEMGMDAPTVER